MADNDNKSPNTFGITVGKVIAGAAMAGGAIYAASLTGYNVNDIVNKVGEQLGSVITTDASRLQDIQTAGLMNENPVVSEQLAGIAKKGADLLADGSVANDTATRTLLKVAQDAVEQLKDADLTNDDTARANLAKVSSQLSGMEVAKAGPVPPSFTDKVGKFFDSTTGKGVIAAGAIGGGYALYDAMDKKHDMIADSMNDDGKDVAYDGHAANITMGRMQGIMRARMAAAGGMQPGYSLPM